MMREKGERVRVFTEERKRGGRILIKTESVYIVYIICPTKGDSLYLIFVFGSEIAGLLESFL